MEGGEESVFHENGERSMIAEVWRQIHGQDNWLGLLDPMDPLLRSELIRYGELAQSCYDAFDSDSHSKYYGRCRFSKSNFFKSLYMDNNSYGYEVTSYIYATYNVNYPYFFKKSTLPSVRKGYAWIGFVAVSNDEMTQRLGRRDIIIAWRGTITRLEWVADLQDFLREVVFNKIPTLDRKVMVESGFLELYTGKNGSSEHTKFSAREQVLSAVARLIEMYPDEELSITLTGHSLGSALATLCAFDIMESIPYLSKFGRVIPICVFSFSGPRVGNLRFKERLEELGVKVLRIVNVYDLVPKSPGLFFNELTPRIMKLLKLLPWSYSHVGVELALDSKDSPFLKPNGNPSCWHNLEALLHLLDGYHGKGRKFEPVQGRDPALVNKGCDFLKDELLIPPNWRQCENKGLIKNKDGRMTQPERPEE